MENIIDKLALFVFKDRKVLFARSRGQTLFYSVGGKRNPGESDLEALNREVLEETGARCVQESLRYEFTFTGSSHGASTDTVLKMTCFRGEIDREPVPTNEIEEFAWFSTADMDRTTEMGKTILDYLAYHGYID